MSLREEMENAADEILRLGGGRVAILPERRTEQTMQGVQLARMVKLFLPRVVEAKIGDDQKITFTFPETELEESEERKA